MLIFKLKFLTQLFTSKHTNIYSLILLLSSSKLHCSLLSFCECLILCCRIIVIQRASFKWFVSLITFSIFWGLVGFIFRLVTIDTILYITALSVLIAFSIINYWMRINIKEFLKSYFSISFIIFFTAIIIIFYLSYDLETYRGYVMLGPPEAEELSPQEYIVYKCSKFLIFINLKILAL